MFWFGLNLTGMIMITLQIDCTFKVIQDQRSAWGQIFKMFWFGSNLTGMIMITLQIDWTYFQSHPRSKVNFGSDFYNVLIWLKFDRNDHDNIVIDWIYFQDHSRSKVHGVVKATYNEICSDYWVIWTVFNCVYSILSVFADYKLCVHHVWGIHWIDTVW